ncbi:hypothetical protein [Candidatus Tisiphia endosymbiont of Oplodontha viridula]
MLNYRNGWLSSRAMKWRGDPNKQLANFIFYRCNFWIATSPFCDSSQ